MGTLTEVKVYLINKYFNKDYSLFDTTVQKTKKEPYEYIFLTKLLFTSIEKNLELYDPLLVLGTNQDLKEKIEMYNILIREWNENEKSHSKELMGFTNFVKDYNIDIQEIDNIILKLLNEDLKRV